MMWPFLVVLSPLYLAAGAFLGLCVAETVGEVVLLTLAWPLVVLWAFASPTERP